MVCNISAQTEEMGLTDSVCNFVRDAPSKNNDNNKLLFINSFQRRNSVQGSLQSTLV